MSRFISDMHKDYRDWRWYYKLIPIAPFIVGAEFFVSNVSNRDILDTLILTVFLLIALYILALLILLQLETVIQSTKRISVQKKLGDYLERLSETSLIKFTTFAKYEKLSDEDKHIIYDMYSIVIGEIERNHTGLYDDEAVTIYEELERTITLLYDTSVATDISDEIEALRRVNDRYESNSDAVKRI